MKRTALILSVLLTAGAHAVALAQAPPPPPPPPPIEAPDAAPPPVPDAAGPDRAGPSRRRWGGPVVRIGSDYTLARGDESAEVFVMRGNATIEGHVRSDVVVVFGTLRIGESAVVGGSLVAIGGEVAIQPGARVEGDFVVVGGTVEAPPGFNADGQHIVVAPEMMGGRLDAVVPWVTRGLLLGRPIVPDLPWVWPIVAILFAVNLVVTLLLERPVRACATTLSRRPLTSLLVGLLILLLVGPVLLLLTLSVIGVAVVPFLLCALLMAWLLGRVAVARWIGLSMVPESDDGTAANSRPRAVRSFAIGFALLVIVYMIPALGIITWATVGVLGLGSAVLAVLAGYRRENPTVARPVTGPGPHSSDLPPDRFVPPVDPIASSSPVPSTPRTGATASASDNIDPLETAMPSQTAAGARAHVPPGPSPFPHTMAGDLLDRPHAPFKDRLAAFVLDLLVVVLGVQLLDIDDGPRVIILLLLAYHILFWTLKATTIGGIICHLRIVRISGEPMRFVDSFVRAFSAIFSLGAAGLGGLWILKDPERQAWHDKIAGTYVVKVPRDYPL
jgi:uncharacterized RDD family membrane protein YckC